jgi:hypothetical protein
MPKPKTDRPAVDLRPTLELLADIDAEALRSGASRHAETIALIEDGLAARRQPLTEAPRKAAAKAPASRSSAKAPAATAPATGRMTMDDVRPKFVSRLKAK